MKPQESLERARQTVSHVYDCLLNECEAERSSLLLPSEFKFVVLVQGHQAPAHLADQIVEQFTSGCSLNGLIELLPDYGHGRPIASKTTSIITGRDSILPLLSALYEAGEVDTSFYDFHRKDATLLHIKNIHRRQV